MMKTKREMVNGQKVKVFLCPLKGKAEKQTIRTRLVSNGESRAVNAFLKQHGIRIEKMSFNSILNF